MNKHSPRQMGLVAVVTVLAACGSANIDGGRTADAAGEATSARSRLQGHLEALAPPAGSGGGAPAVVLSRATLMVPGATATCSAAGVCVTGRLWP